MNASRLLLGVDVGGTNLRVGVIDGLEVIDFERMHADFSGLCRGQPAAQALAAIQAMLFDALQAMLHKYPGVSAIGIGFPGFIDPVSGRVTQSPNLPGLHDVDLLTPLRAQLGRPVIIENDALAAAFGEYHLLGQQDGGLVYLGLGTGVGGGMVYGGAPHTGEHGVAMEVGHLIVEPGGRQCGCGNRGCMEQYSSAGGVMQSYQEASGTKLPQREIAQLAEAGDAAALAAYAIAGERLAQALTHILKVADIGHVVIGGGMSAAWPLIAPAFERRLEADLIPALRGRVRVSLSRAEDQAGMIGAALLAARQS